MACSALSSEHSLVLCLEVFVYVCWSKFEGLSLFVFNSLLTLAGSSSGLGVSHTEHIISLHSSVNSRVSWDWLSELVSLNLELHSVEVGDGLEVTLSLAVWVFGLSLLSGQSDLLGFLLNLFLYGVVCLVNVDSEEGVNFFWLNWLLQSKTKISWWTLLTKINYLPWCRSPLPCELRQFEQ